MDWLSDWLNDWVKQGLIDAIMGNFSNMFDTINTQVGEITINVGQTPQGWDV